MAAAAALVTGTAMGVLTTACGLGLAGSPWEFHFVGHHVAAVAVALTGVTVVILGIVMTVDVIGGANRLRHRR
ncbi:MAG TPA: hypothetical protein VHF87_20165 [Methylomirabilota bacterium]|nr:hypothetical protein [Methylomirabilota bacterium]